jgi:hypothetical protein
VLELREGLKENKQNKVKKFLNNKQLSKKKTRHCTLKIRTRYLEKGKSMESGEE